MKPSLPLRAMHAMHARHVYLANGRCLASPGAFSRAFCAPPNSASRRHYSSSTSGPQRSSSRKLEPISSDAANPPATTRPPPLELPERKSDTSTFSHLFSTGKAYLSFYKTGLKNIYINRQLLQATSSASPGQPETRSHLQLRTRTQHDLRCLPIFGVLLLICGEFTPFVVLLVPSLVPFTCRIPAQIAKIQRTTEARRQQSFADLSALTNGSEGGAAALSQRVKDGHAARSLGLVGAFWDRIGPWAPAWLSRRRVRARLSFLALDDELLLKAGGVPALEDSEVRLACAERGINVLGRSASDLRGVLGAWLRRSASGRDGQGQQARLELLTMQESRWPTHR
ncbi:hypothetical protein GQ53DRAFT_755208 [Thozetella sp. PMI_491]|nr:hypothetical protein GQ53DRAFT_755208 [Thozetella sp. PMI_491]